VDQPQSTLFDNGFRAIKYLVTTCRSWPSVPSSVSVTIRRISSGVKARYNERIPSCTLIEFTNAATKPPKSIKGIWLRTKSSITEPRQVCPTLRINATKLLCGKMMHHGDGYCDIGHRQPITDRVGAKNHHGKPPLRRVQIDADQIHAKLGSHLFQQRAVPAADIQDCLYSERVLP
jgi:hypothetical protein